MSKEQNEKKLSDNKRTSTATTLIHGAQQSSEPDVLIVDWDGPTDPKNPKKPVLYDYPPIVLQC
jgi:hypothetical protein